MPRSFSIWLDDETDLVLGKLANKEERKLGAMVRVLIRRAARESGLIPISNLEAPSDEINPEDQCNDEESQSNNDL